TLIGCCRAAASCFSSLSAIAAPSWRGVLEASAGIPHEDLRQAWAIPFCRSQGHAKLTGDLLYYYIIAVRVTHPLAGPWSTASVPGDCGLSARMLFPFLRPRPYRPCTQYSVLWPPHPRL
ncbi:hypothetical protein T310_8662, partial [Rasamsonia emersonii CBS 393.64]